MARTTNAASNWYLEIDDTPVTNYPFTVACWARSPTITGADDRCLVSINDKSEGGVHYRLALNQDNGGELLIAASDAANYSHVSTTTAHAVDTWFHACGVIVSATERHIFLDGGGKNTDTLSRTPAGLDRVSVGREGDVTPGDNFDGDIAEVVFYDVALTDAEVAILATGISPRLLHPESLVFYAPLYGNADPEPELISGMSLVNFSAAKTDHPPILQPTSQGVYFTPFQTKEIALSNDNSSNGKSRSLVWWNTYQSRWDGLIVDSLDDHYIVKDLTGTPAWDTDIIEDRANSKGTIHWDDTNKKLYILGAEATTSEFWIMDYNSGTDTYSFEQGATGAGLQPTGFGGSPDASCAALTVTPNQDAWLFSSDATNLYVQRWDYSASLWETSTTSIKTIGEIACQSALYFANGGTTYACVFCSENATVGGDYHFLYIDQDSTAITTPGNWTDETLPAHEDDKTENTVRADDHCTLCKDSNENLYCTIKTEKGIGNSADHIRMLWRTPAGTWKGQYPIWFDDEDKTRPTMCIRKVTGSSAEELVFMTATLSGGPTIVFKTALVSDLIVTEEQILFEDNVGLDLSDASSYQGDFIATDASGFCALCTNFTNSSNWIGYGTLPALPIPPIQLVGRSIYAQDSSRIGTTGFTMTPNLATKTDDLMLLFCCYNDEIEGVSSNPLVWTAPSGFTEMMVDYQNDSYDRSICVYYKIATSDAEAAVNIVNNDATAEQTSGVILTYRNVDTTTPFDVVYAAGSHLSHFDLKNTPNDDVYPSITTVNDDALVIAIEHIGGGTDVSGDVTPLNYDMVARLIAANYNSRYFSIHSRTIETAAAETPPAAAYTLADALCSSTNLTFALRYSPSLSPILIIVPLGPVR